VSEGVGAHEVSKVSEVSGVAPAPPESFAGLMVPGGSGRHQVSIPRRMDNANISNEMRVIVDQGRHLVRNFSILSYMASFVGFCGLKVPVVYHKSRRYL
jgi:hypothetical protein